MIIIKRTDSDNKDFQQLVQYLEDYLDEQDKETHRICEPYNRIDTIKQAVVAYEETLPIGCGAIREYSSDTMEIKRMFVLKDERGKGIASLILNELETWSKELGFKRCILETGQKMPEAIGLYEKKAYTRIPNYGQYEHLAGSICFEKDLMNVKIETTRLQIVPSSQRVLEKCGMRKYEQVGESIWWRLSEPC